MTSFERLGVTERMIREALAAALSRGGDFASNFGQSRNAAANHEEGGADIIPSQDFQPPFLLSPNTLYGVAPYVGRVL